MEHPHKLLNPAAHFDPRGNDLVSEMRKLIDSVLVPFTVKYRHVAKHAKREQVPVLGHSTASLSNDMMRGVRLFSAARFAH